MSNIAARRRKHARWKDARWNDEKLSGWTFDSERLAAQQPDDHSIHRGRRNRPDDRSVGRIDAIHPRKRLLFYFADHLRQFATGVQHRERKKKADSAFPHESSDLVRSV